MIIDALFSNVLVYDITGKLDVKQGEQFSLIMDDGTMIRVFADSDPVLRYQQNGAEIVVNAENVGESEMQFQNPERVPVRVVTIRVLPTIAMPAVNLGVSAEEPEPK